MALTDCAASVIEESSLVGWEWIAGGGFGQVYKARHRHWLDYVAIKLLNCDGGSSSGLLREVEMMRQGRSPHVIHVHGIFKGRPDVPGSTVQLGLVMEFMDSGSLKSLQDTLRGPPPWPLAFRLVHQVALGINFLHSLSPALLHLDLKPSNVLLDSSLRAKLSDFGLARFYHSITRGSKKNNDEEGGTLGYMPPEAFDLSYRPTRASDIYSYGILLWSIITGEQPYPHALSDIVRLRVPLGDRPLLQEIEHQSADCAGLTELVELMKKCWEGEPSNRPSSGECTTVTEKLYEMHKRSINDAVHQVQNRLDQKKEEELSRQLGKAHITQPVRGQAVIPDVPTGRAPVQERAGLITKPRPKTEDKGKCDPPPPQPACVAEVDKGRSADRVKSASVDPIHLAPPSPSNGSLPQGRRKPKLNQFSYERQSSSPASGLHIRVSNVIGFQSGNNNTMYIERKRHPTAPQ